MKQIIIASDNFHEDLTIQLTECAHDGIFVITDHNTLKACWPDERL